MSLTIGVAITPRGPQGMPGLHIAPGPLPATLPVAAAGRWHAGAATVAEAGGRVLSASALAGPGVTAGAEGLGPLAMTDRLGRKFWRFTGTDYLDVGAGLTFANRAMAVFAVCRALGSSVVFGPGNRTGYGAGSTAVNTGGGALDWTSNGGSAPFLRGFSRAASLDASNRSRIVAGTQLQLAGAVTRSTANGGTRLYLNTDSANVVQPSISAAGIAGAEIGRSPYAPGASGSWAAMDLYELVVFDRTLTNAEADAVAAALVGHWDIPAITSQLVLDGDSITAGAGLAVGQNAAAVLSAPGAGWVPPGWRVVSVGSSGNQVPDLVTRRDATNSWASTLLPGQNVLAFEIGRNDLSGLTAAQHYANVVAYLNTPTTGVLQRGWTVRALSNIASGASLQPKIEAWRALLQAPQFLIDTLSDAGNLHAGRVGVIRTDLIEKAPDGTLFATTADSASGTYYQGDSTHPSAAGAAARATGADTPQYGIAHGLG